jgi:hypothetical protein
MTAVSVRYFSENTTTGFVSTLFLYGEGLSFWNFDAFIRRSAPLTSLEDHRFNRKTRAQAALRLRGKRLWLWSNRQMRSGRRQSHRPQTASA